MSEVERHDHRPRVPAGWRVYAVGDVHGRADLLDRLHGLIAEDAAVGAAGERAVVYLGDYVDRGPASAGVIGRLADGPPPRFAATFLKGNHEDMLTRFLEDGSTADIWLANGGMATLASYGIEAAARPAGAAEVEALRRRLRAAMDPRHLDFLDRLQHSHVVGDYLFVHAGVRPEVPLERQAPGDLMWIRHPFLDWTEPFERMIVHGHTVSPVPDVRTNRIGVDTGAYASDCLTCLVLEGTSRWFLRT